MSFAALRSSEQASELPPAYSDSTTSGQQSAVSLVRLASTGRSSRFLPDDVVDDEDVVLRPLNDAGPIGRNDPAVKELPPTYTPFDEWAKVFSMCGSVINTVSAERLEKPRYQLKQQLSKSGRLWHLQIRRLLPSESRRLSMSSASVSSVDFDVDTMLYDAENLAALYALRNRMEVQIKGRKAGTLQGHIELCDKGRDGFEFKHCTRPAAKHWSREENIKKMNRWGYRSDMELEKTSLFTCRNIGRDGNAEWRQKDELTDVVVTVAVEMDGELVLQKQVSERVRDVLVTCWATKHWAMGNLDSGRPPDVKLSRWLTVG